MTANDVLTAAFADLGYKESPANSNRTKFWAELDPALQGNPWCGVAVSYWFRKAGAPLPSIDKPYGFVYVPDAEGWAKRYGKWRNTPQPGLVAIYGFGRAVGVHTGIVASVLDATTFKAMEGNTGSGNDTNGGEVMLRTRTLHDARGFIDFGLSPPAPIHIPKEMPVKFSLATDPETGGSWKCQLEDGAMFCDDGAPYLGGLNQHPDWHATDPTSGGKHHVQGVAAHKGANGRWGYAIWVFFDEDGQLHPYRFDRP